MDSMLETIDLDADEASELLFKVKIEGIEPSPAKVRLVCEVGDLAYMFNGHSTADDGVVQFLLPSMKDKIKEGTYQSRVEVLIENRYFSPVEFNLRFKRPVSVVAESVRVAPRKVVPQVTVTASPLVTQVKKPVVAPTVTRREPVTQPKPATPRTLKERYLSNQVELDELSHENEELIRQTALSLIRGR